MRAIVYGIGAIGGTVAAALALAGREVVGIARGAQLKTIRERGLVLRTPGGAACARFPCVGDPGEVDWRAHLLQLKQIGYRGMFSLETHWRLQKIDDSILHLPAGYGFSNGAEPASRICMHNLKVLVETL